MQEEVYDGHDEPYEPANSEHDEYTTRVFHLETTFLDILRFFFLVNKKTLFMRFFLKKTYRPLYYFVVLLADPANIEQQTENVITIGWAISEEFGKKKLAWEFSNESV